VRSIREQLEATFVAEALSATVVGADVLPTAFGARRE
jgi:hypothetical protein